MSEIAAEAKESETRLTARNIVTAAFRALLLRDPDPTGLQGWCEEIVAGRVDLEGLLQRMLRSEEFAQRSAAVLAHYVGPGHTRFVNDVSQYGETWLMIRAMVNSAARHRIVVDVGARGRLRSNSYDLLRHFGWRGVLIEANPLLIDSIRHEFAGLDVAIVNAAVSDYVGQARFYIGVNDDVSSLTREAAAGWGAIQNEVQVKVEHLGTILRAHDVPADFDLLSIDAEGEDVKILNDVVATGYLPRWVIIEASFDFQTRSLHSLPLTDAVIERYRLIDQTSANLILQAQSG